MNRRCLQAGLPALRRRQAPAPGLPAVRAALIDDRALAVALGIDAQDRPAVLEQAGGGMAQILSFFPIDDDLPLAFAVQIDPLFRRGQGAPIEQGVPQEAVVRAVEIAMDGIEIEGQDAAPAGREIQDRRAPFELVLALDGAADEHLGFVLFGRILGVLGLRRVGSRFEGGYPLVWVGLLDEHAPGVIRCVASAGDRDVINGQRGPENRSDRRKSIPKRMVGPREFDPQLRARAVDRARFPIDVPDQPAFQGEGRSVAERDQEPAVGQVFLQVGQAGPADPARDIVGRVGRPQAGGLLCFRIGHRAVFFVDAQDLVLQPQVVVAE